MLFYFLENHVEINFSKINFYYLSQQHLAVIQCNTIVRCRACRTYINPFVYFVDSKRWKCNLCFRLNERNEYTEIFHIY